MGKVNKSNLDLSQKSQRGRDKVFRESKQIRGLWEGHF